MNRHLAFRAKLVLSCADGVSSLAVARRFRTSNQTVCKGRQRFIAPRLDGLCDEPRVNSTFDALYSSIGRPSIPPSGC